MTATIEAPTVSDALAPLIRKDHRPTPAEIDREVHRLLAERPSVRALPDSHDDPASPYFVPKQLREVYVRVEIREDRHVADPSIARQLQGPLIRLAQQYAIRDREREVWTDNRKVAEGLGPDFLAKFLKQHADDSGRPFLEHAHTMSGWTHTPPQPGAEHIALARHALIIEQAGREGGIQRVQETAAKIVRDRIAATCDVCAAYLPPPVASAGQSTPPQITRRGHGSVLVQFCPDCEMVARFLIALEPTPDRMPRVSAIAHALAATGNLPGPISDKTGDDLAERVANALRRQVRHSKRRKGIPA